MDTTSDRSPIFCFPIGPTSSLTIGSLVAVRLVLVKASRLEIIESLKSWPIPGNLSPVRANLIVEPTAGYKPSDISFIVNLEPTYTIVSYKIILIYQCMAHLSLSQSA
jgi:hypothetical protein